VTAPPLQQAWQDVRDHLRRAVADSTFDLWLAPLEPVEFSDNTLVLSAPDEARAWIAERFARVLQSCAAAALGPEVTVDLVAPGAAASPSRPSAPAADRHLKASAFNPKLTFDHFVIGDSNRLAHAAALAVAESPGQAYNPLFIYGPPGLGKTHLLHSIGNYVRSYGGPMSVRYVTVEQFTNEFVAALQSGSIEAFKARFRHNDVLLVDDVQFLESKARTEEEFFHTFNALYDAGAQLVITSDRLPRDLGSLEDRLRERFEAGLVTDVRRPDRDTRLTILRKRAHHDRVALAEPAALEAIADRITDNIRVLEGALVRVVAFSSLTGRPLDVGLVEEVLGGLYRHETPVRRTVDDIQVAVAEAFGITRQELVSTTRTARLAWPRQVGMYLARELTDQTLPAIGRAFGGRDHSTVMYACKRTSTRMAADADSFESVRVLTELLRGT